MKPTRLYQFEAIPFPRRLLNVATLILLAGCVGTTTQEPPVSLVDLQAADTMRPPWHIGDWWETRFFMDLGPGYREEGGGRVVVSDHDEQGYSLLAAARDLAVLDYYFDLFHVGRVDPLRQPIVEGEPVEIFPRTLAPGVTWASWFPVPVFGPDRLQPAPVNLTSSVYDEDRADGRLRITGRIDAGFFLDLDYDPSLDWFSYVRLTELATGRIVLAVDVDDHGSDYHGPVHEVTGTILHERLVVTPPCTGPGACDPSLANAPPIMRVSSQTHQFAETVAYLFSFPLTDAGGAAVELVVTDPDGNVARFNHAGMSDRFEGTFFRRGYNIDPQGEWSFHSQIAGTGGAYAALFGLDDHPREL